MNGNWHFSSLSSQKITTSSMKVNWYCSNQYFWKLGRIICDLRKSTTETHFSLQLPNPRVAGTEEASMQQFLSASELKDTGWREWENKLSDCTLWGDLTWHDIWEQSMSSPPMRNGFPPKMNHIENIFYSYVQVRADGWGWGANFSPMALGTGLSIRGGSTVDRPEQILQKATQISIYSSFQVNLLVLCLLAFVQGEAGEEMFFTSYLYLLAPNIQ